MIESRIPIIDLSKPEPSGYISPPPPRLVRWPGFGATAQVAKLADALP